MNVFKAAVVAWSGGTARAGGPRRVHLRGAGAVGAAVCAAISCTAIARGEVIAAWNMNGFVPGSSNAIAASTGLGSLDIAPFGDGVGTLLGTSLGAVKGDLAGESLSIAGNGYNGQALTFGFDATMHRDLTVSFAVRRSSTGFATNRLEWWSGSKWTTLATFGASSTTWDLRAFDFSAVDAMDGQYGVFRFVLDGATGSTGSIRFDNVVFSGTVVPAPGALALLSLAGVAGLGSRRQRSSR
ncbi:MAG: PEP-CTERM sorting domain-containing protein [Planctomycetaceae bacterium]|nr:PEP-CTERM sorting domain-containing protein [Planctomycetaceae bacterium]